MIRDRVLEELWETAPRGNDVVDPEVVTRLPPAAQRYLLHALAPGARLAHAARLHMSGTIRLDDTWCPFEAVQVLRWDRGFVWKASVRRGGLPVIGSDRWVDGEGSMKWRLLGIIPVMTADGPDITRSAAGRLHIETMWLPSVLLDSNVQWLSRDGLHPEAVIRAHDEESHIELAIDDRGRVRTGQLSRWGSPEGRELHYVDFGAIVEDEATFEGITIPTKLRIGWFFGTPRFEEEGEFFRVTVDRVEFR